MAITVKFFAALREHAGRNGQTLEFEHGMTARDVWVRAMPQSEIPENLMVAVNMEYTKIDAPLADGDDVAFFPAVTGG